MANSVIPFSFETLAIRAVQIDGQPWFIAADVCAALDIGNVSLAVNGRADRQNQDGIDDDEKGVATVNIRSETGFAQDREFIIVNESGLYSLIFKSRKPEARRFKRWVTSEVLPTIRKTGSYTAPGQSPATERTAVALLVAESTARMLRLDGSSLLGYMGRVTERLAPELIGTLPVYAVNVPAGSIGIGSSEPTFSLTELGHKHGLTVSTASLNKKLAAVGIIERMTRPSTKGEKAFWSITDKGRAFGCNLTSPANQKETQPVWFASCFPALMAEIR